MSYDAPPPVYPPQYGYGGGAPGPMPDNYLVWGILATIFCCLPFGIVSIVYSTQVSSKYYGGDYVGAAASSENAKKWAIWSAVASVAFTVLAVLLFIVVALAAR